MPANTAGAATDSRRRSIGGWRKATRRRSVRELWHLGFRSGQHGWAKIAHSCGFSQRANGGRLSDAEPQRGPAVKSRSQAHGAKCEKSLNDKVFGAANESLL
jgi:hypothetical protein